MHDYSNLTLIVIGVTVALLVGYDVVIKIKEPSGNATISWVLLTLAKTYPVVAFVLGFVFGHILFQNCNVP
jgi:hypothetical protein